MSNSQDANNHAAANHAGPSVATYIWTFVALMVLLSLTYVMDLIPLGDWNTVIALGIAVAKTLLIVWFFMHLSSAPGLVRIASLVGLVWLSVGMLMVLADNAARGWHDTSGEASPAVWSPDNYPAQLDDRVR